jgi:hypothetical protein
MRSSAVGRASSGTAVDGWQADGGPQWPSGIHAGGMQRLTALGSFRLITLTLA